MQKIILEKNRGYKLFLGIIFLFCAVFFPLNVQAASNLYLNPASGSHILGNDFPVTIEVNTGADTINAVSVDLVFDKAKFIVSSIDVSSSVFSMWPEYPSYSNTNGTIHFSGGTPKTGFSGTGVLLVINFKGVSDGFGDASFSAGSKVLKNDGLGTNITGTTTGGIYEILPVPLSVSCSASPSSTLANTLVTFTANASGGAGNYTYSWANACFGTGSTCSNSFITLGTKTATVTVTSNGKTASANCSTVIGLPGLNVSCSASPNPTTINTPVAFTVNATGGDGNYIYSWSNACTGTDSTCTKSFTTQGTKTATVTVTSNGKTASSNCSTDVNLPGLNVSCTSSAQSVDINTSVTFTANASGGDGNYTYSWSNACIGTDSTCSESYSASGLKTAKVTVTSSGQNSSADCLLVVNINCPTCSGSSSGGSGGGTVEIIKTITNTETIVKNIIEQVPGPVKYVVVEAQKIVDAPEVSVATKTVSTAGAAAAAVAAVSPLFTLPFFELFLIPLRLFGLLLIALGIRKRGLSWGVAYDSVTKRPLDPAYITLKNTEGKEVYSAITDLDGRFGFLVEPGIYQLQASKTNYSFPSKKLAGKSSDELYADLYFGENIIVKTSGETIAKNIPLDPIKFDWNEYAKKSHNLNIFYSKWDVILRKAYDLIFAIGFIVAIISYILAPYPYNTVIIILYIIFLLLRVFGIKPKSYGYITEKATGIPLSFPIIRVMTADGDRLIASKSADRYGKYYCLVPPGKYYVKIEKKNEDGSYSLIHTSAVIDVSKKGIIKERFKV
jgi:hypothetical protein